MVKYYKKILYIQKKITNFSKYIEWYTGMLYNSTDKYSKRYIERYTGIQYNSVKYLNLSIHS